MKRIRAIAASLLASGALILGGLVPVSTASAAAYPSFDVTKFSATNLVFSTDGCKKSEIRVGYRTSGVGDWSVHTEVRRNNQLAGYADFASFGRQTKDRFQVCDWDGFGKYVIGPSEVSASSDENTPYAWLDFTDRTASAFYVRAQARVQLSVVRSGKNVRLTARAQRYDPDNWDTHYSAYNPTARLQVKSGRHWKNDRTVRLHGGRAAVTVKSKAKRTYRLTFGQVSWATGATSRGVRR